MSIDWLAFLTGRRARDDVFDSFPPERMNDNQPAMLNDASVIAAARVGARLLEVVARRGGSRVDVDAVQRLRALLDEAMPESAQPLCDDEAARILDWLETAEQVPPDERDDSRLPPELDLMLGADIDSRISVAGFALDESFDLELEYFDTQTNTWPRIRCTPREIHTADGEDAASTTEPMLVVERRGEVMELPVKNIRWLMPVGTSKKPAEQSPAGESGGRLLRFPTSRLDNGSDEPPADDTPDGPDSHED